MRGFLILCVVLGASGYVLKSPELVKVQPRFETSTWLQRQKLILELFENVCKESSSLNIVNAAQEFETTDVLARVTLPEAATEFKKLIVNKALLPKGEIFSEYNSEELQELKTIYKVMFYAADFDTFYKIAAWTRQNINCGVFIDALYAAIIHRRDTDKMAVPAPYEILPNYFIRRDVLARAVLLARNKEIPVKDVLGIHTDGNVITVDANYTAPFFDNLQESKLAYFREDIGLNAFYYFTKLRKSYWANRVEDIDDSIRYNLAEYWYWLVRQLNARYNLERITNGLPEVEEISFTIPITTGYDPMLMYTNGKYFPDRKAGANIRSVDSTYLVNMESEFKTLLSKISNAKTNEILRAIDEFLISTEKKFDSTARRVLGTDLIGTNNLPSVLELYATTLRDPVFYSLNKLYLRMFNEGLNILTPYAKNDLYFPGVEILNVEVKKMQTYFDYSELDITNTVRNTVADTLVKVKIGQPRLNHKPFSILINVSSLVSQMALVKIFIGPKFAPSDINTKKDLLKQLDSFEYNLKLGSNVIIRKSNDINNIAPDLLSSSDVLNKIKAAEIGLEPLYFTNIESIVGFPSRLVLPKGTSEGYPLQLYIIITPLTKSNFDGATYTGVDRDDFSLGFPFDRRIDDSKVFDLPNTMFKDIIITHKGDSKIYNYGGEGASKKWYSIGMEKEKDKKNKKEGSFDYMSKKGKYDKKKKDDTDGKVKTIDPIFSPSVLPLVSTKSDLNVIPIPKYTTENSIDKNFVEFPSNENGHEEDFVENQFKYKLINSNVLLQSKSPFSVKDKDEKANKKVKDSSYSKEGISKDKTKKEKIKNLSKETQDEDTKLKYEDSEENIKKDKFKEFKNKTKPKSDDRSSEKIINKKLPTDIEGILPVDSVHLNNKASEIPKVIIFNPFGKTINVYDDVSEGKKYILVNDDNSEDSKSKIALSKYNSSPSINENIPPFSAYKSGTDKSQGIEILTPFASKNILVKDDAGDIRILTPVSNKYVKVGGEYPLNNAFFPTLTKEKPGEKVKTSNKNTLALDDKTGTVKIITPFSSKDISVDEKTGSFKITTPFSSKDISIDGTTGAIKIITPFTGKFPAIDDSTGVFQITTPFSNKDISVTDKTNVKIVTPYSSKDISKDDKTGSVKIVTPFSSKDFTSEPLSSFTGKISTPFMEKDVTAGSGKSGAVKVSTPFADISIGGGESDGVNVVTPFSSKNISLDDKTRGMKILTPFSSKDIKIGSNYYMGTEPLLGSTGKNSASLSDKGVTTDQRTGGIKIVTPFSDISVGGDKSAGVKVVTPFSSKDISVDDKGVKIVTPFSKKDIKLEEDFTKTTPLLSSSFKIDTPFSSKDITVSGGNIGGAKQINIGKDGFGLIPGKKIKISSDIGFGNKDISIAPFTKFIPSKEITVDNIFGGKKRININDGSVEAQPFMGIPPHYTDRDDYNDDSTLSLGDFVTWVKLQDYDDENRQVYY